MISTARLSSIAVCRTPTREDALISPFLLDPTSITYLSKHSTHHHLATWLHMPVMVRVIPTRSQVLHHVHYLSRLRHPNLEQFLGAVVDDRSQKAILTEFINGTSVDHLLRHSKITAHVAGVVALDVARALVYLHATTGRAHAGIAPKAIIFDHARSRAVVLLSTQACTTAPWAAPEAGKSNVGMAADVYSLAALLVGMVSRIRGEKLRVTQALVHFLPQRLQPVVTAALNHDPKLRPSVKQLCQALTDSQAEFC